MITGYDATHAVSGQDNPYSVEMETLKGLKGTRTESDAIKITDGRGQEDLPGHPLWH